MEPAAESSQKTTVPGSVVADDPDGVTVAVSVSTEPPVSEEAGETERDVVVAVPANAMAGARLRHARARPVHTRLRSIA